MTPSVLLLSCNNEQEADIIIKNLLTKKLIICANKLPIESSFLWKGGIDSAREILLLLESMEEKFSEIEKEVSDLHASETFVLFSLPVMQTTQKVKDWITEELA